MDRAVERENILCNFCESNNYSHFDCSDGWNIVKCKGCGFHYTNPRPFLSQLPDFYKEDYFNDIRHSKKFYNDDGSIRNSTGNYNNRIKTIENHVNCRGSLLEIGAARGGFLKVMRERGWQISGVEISENAVKLAKEINNVDLFCGTFDQFNTKNKFDVICMYQTLEHVSNPKKVIEKAYLLLNKKGILVIEVPNIKGFDIKKDKRRKKLVYDLPRHLNHFSPKFLSNQLIKIGFSIIEKDRYYPQFLLDWMETKQKGKNELHTGSNCSENNSKEIPLKKHNKTWKVKFLDNVSKFYPGWRFTLVAQK